MKFIPRMALGLLAAGIAITSALAEARKVRIASHVSEFSPLHAQSQLFAAEI